MRNINNINKRTLSTSNLAKGLKMSSKAMFQQLVEMGLITREENNWELTPAGKSMGGAYQEHQKYGRYIVWPESIIGELNDTVDNQGQNFVTATYIGQNFDIPANRINSILSELGWIKKHTIKGWEITDFGKRQGGVKSRYKATGIPYVRWPESVIRDKTLITSIGEAKGDTPALIQEQHYENQKTAIEFRDKFKPEHRAQDGHCVRSKSELIIDNWLYHSKVVHAYERKLPVEESLYCDFYLPTGKVYIEYWGLDEESYNERRKRKLEIYKKYNFNLIELIEKDVSNLDDILPAKLLEFQVPIE